MNQLNFTDEEIGLVMKVLGYQCDPLMLLSEELVDIGHILRVKRTNDMLTIHELGSLLKMSPSLISEVETGQRNLKGKKLEIIEDYIYKTLFLHGCIETLLGDIITGEYVNNLGIDKFKYNV